MNLVFDDNGAAAVGEAMLFDVGALAEAVLGDSEIAFLSKRQLTLLAPTLRMRAV
jgi:hypothetical protein